MTSHTDSQAFNPGVALRILAIVRLIGILLITLFVAIPLAILRFVLSPWPNAKRAVRLFYFKLWSRWVCALLGARSNVFGELPAAQCMVASNHLGYLDILVIAQYAPAVFVSKADVLQWPVVGWLTKLADTLYIARERHRDIPRANQSIAAALQAGDNVVLFPEGTSSNSDWILPVRPPLLQVAASEQFPVSTIALYYQTDTPDPHAHQAICYFGDMSFGSHVWRLLHLRGFKVDIRFSGALLQDTERKTLALKVRKSILDLQTENEPDSPKPNLDESYAFQKFQSHG
ncbi:MAG: lysophospholipid acyltransferase family protein [Woeseiaceae bacterium]